MRSNFDDLVTGHSTAALIKQIAFALSNLPEQASAAQLPNKSYVLQWNCQAIQALKEIERRLSQSADT